jgi:single-strand DNA-binding protein
MNKIVIVGRLGGDPDSVFFQSGAELVQFSLAVNRPFKNQNGERETDWFKCKTTKESLIKYAKEYLKKGDQVAISGAMLMIKGKDGKIWPEVKIESLQNLTSRGDKSERQERPAEDLEGDCPF